MNEHGYNQASPDTLLVTGANGFIGSELCAHLFDLGWPVKAALRPQRNFDLNLERVLIDSVDGNTDWGEALQGVSVVIHLVGISSVDNRQEGDVLSQLRRVNVDGTLNLARQAAESGVRRFIFISSIKVNGENTAPGHAFSSKDLPQPKDAYAQAKFEAERQLKQITERTTMDLVVIRPPLVYGKGVQGNFLSLMRWLNRGLPLPLGSINNQRTLLALDNLIDLIKVCIHHSAAANQTLLAGDPEDLSTPELLTRLARLLGKKARLWPIPESILKTILLLLNKRSLAEKLTGSLQINVEETHALVGWRPPFCVDEALAKTVEDFLRSRQ